MSRVARARGVIGAVVVIACSAGASGSDPVRTIEHDGLTRRYVLHVPEGLVVPEAGAPLVLALHGFAQTAPGMVAFTGLNATADREGFVVAYPEGTGPPLMLSWNEGAAWKTVDDVGFIGRVIDDVGTVVRIDGSRVYATGMSNGAMMCYRLASELSDRIAAIAPVSGTMATSGFRPGRPVSVLHFHGTADALVPYEGPRPGGRVSRVVDFTSVERSVAACVEHIGAPVEAVVERLPDNDPEDGTRVESRRHGPGRDATEVILYRIEGGGHTWPGGPPQPAILGRTTRDLADPNGLIWEFFARHPMPARHREPASPGESADDADAHTNSKLSAEESGR